MHEFRTGQLSGIPLHGPDAFEKAARRIGKQKLFSGSIDHEFICFRNELLGRNQWTREIVLPIHHVDDAIFRDEIGLLGDKRTVKPHFFKHMMRRVVSIRDH